MKFKHYLMTAASCMAILGSGVSYADATASWHATSPHHRKAPTEDGQFIAAVSADKMIDRLNRVLTGELALTDEQKKSIHALADAANQQIETQRTKLSDAQKGLEKLHQETITTSEQFNILHNLLNQRALAMSDMMFAKQQFLMSINHIVLVEKQREAVETKLKEKTERHREDPNKWSTPQRQDIMRGA